MHSTATYASIMLAAGIGVPVLAALNAALGVRLGSPVAAATILFTVALCFTGVILVFAGPSKLAGAVDAPKHRPEAALAELLPHLVAVVQDRPWTHGISRGDGPALRLAHQLPDGVGGTLGHQLNRGSERRARLMVADFVGGFSSPAGGRAGRRRASGRGAVGRPG